MAVYLGQNEVILRNGISTTDADATAADILVGKTAYVDDKKLLGTCPFVDSTDADAVAADLLIGKTAYVDNVKVTGTAPDTSDGTALAGEILQGETAYVNNTKITGTIPSKGTETFTPGTSNQIINSGQYLSGNQTILGDSDLIAENIKKDVTIFGVTGTLKGATSNFGNAPGQISTYQWIQYKSKIYF